MSTGIFTPMQQAEFEMRLQGKKKNYKLWYKIKPKLKEVLELFKIRKKIEKLIN
jgi:hypothetical protein